MEVPGIADGHEEGHELSGHGGPGRPRHPPVEEENADGIQNGVDDRPHQHAGHGIFGASIRPGQIAHGIGDDEQGHAQAGDAGIADGIGHDVLCSPEGGEQRLQKELDHHRVGQPEEHHHADGVAHGLGRPLRVPLPQGQEALPMPMSRAIARQMVVSG